MKRKAKHRSRNKGLIIIALSKFFYAVVVTLATVIALNLMHKDVSLHAARWIDMLRLDPDNRYIATVLRKLRVVHTEDLKKLSALGFFYVALFLVEGTGLMLEKRWAEWLTIIATGLLIPIEVAELLKEPTFAKSILLATNLAVVVFLSFLIARRKTGAK